MRCISSVIVCTVDRDFMHAKILHFISLTLSLLPKFVLLFPLRSVQNGLGHLSSFNALVDTGPNFS